MRTIVAAAAAVLMAGLAVGVANPEELVDITWGAQGIFEYSRGNLLPLVQTPWAFNAWTVYTAQGSDIPSGWWWKPLDRYFYGIRCTHRPSPWISDWGHFALLPLMVGGKNTKTDQSAFSVYDPLAETTEWRPYYFTTMLPTIANINGETKIEVTPTNHAAMSRITYPTLSATPSPLFDETRVINFRLPTYLDNMSFNTTRPGVLTINGFTMSAQDPSNAVKTYIVAEIETTAKLASSGFSGQVGAARYHPTPGKPDVFIVRMATSLISQKQAWTNLRAELGTQTFEQVMAAAKKSWNEVLTAVDVEPHANADAKQTNLFYLNYYRAAQFPRFISETDETGKEVHFSTYATSQYAHHSDLTHEIAAKEVPDSMIFDGPLVTDSGFWDAYRTVYPWLTVTHTKTLGRMLQGWINAYKEGGWLPKWASPGYRNGMVGTMGDVTLSDAIINEIGGFNVSEAMAAMMKDAFVVSSQSNQGREDLSQYISLGYLPEGVRENVAVSLNFMLSDFAISKAAAKVGGYATKQKELAQRATNYGKLLNPDGFMRSKDQSGAWIEPFDQFAWGGSYTESGPWQYRFYVPHDPKGLAALYKKNGVDMCKKLQEAQTMPSTFHTGGYGGIIHEMTEMAVNCWGQYAHDNQPVHYMLYMFTGISDTLDDSCANLGQYWLRKAVTELYLPQVDSYSGDEDNGEMAAWYLLSSVGLYSLAPGSGEYTLGMPLFKKTTITLDSGKKLTITSDEKVEGKTMRPNTKAGSTYPAVSSVTFNGVKVTGTTIPYAQLRQGGTLAFTMKYVTKSW